MNLPDKPSDLIELALSDLRKCEADPRYKIDMEVYHEASTMTCCLVCLAGSVMAKTLECDPELDADPCDQELFSIADAQKLDALDNFRLGEVADGFREMEIDLPPDFPQTVAIPEYTEDPIGFKREMRTLAGRLRASGA